MFHALVERLRLALPDFGRHLAVDGTAVKAHTNQRRSKSSDPDAAWGVRQSCDKGGGERETKRWLGSEATSSQQKQAPLSHAHRQGGGWPSPSAILHTASC